MITYVLDNPELYIEGKVFSYLQTRVNACHVSPIKEAVSGQGVKVHARTPPHGEIHAVTYCKSEDIDKLPSKGLVMAVSDNYPTFIINAESIAWNVVKELNEVCKIEAQAVAPHPLIRCDLYESGCFDGDFAKEIEISNVHLKDKIYFGLNIQDLAGEMTVNGHEIKGTGGVFFMENLTSNKASLCVKLTGKCNLQYGIGAR